MEEPEVTKPKDTDKDVTGDGKKPEKVFTQVDIDRIIADRLTRQKAQFADYDDLKKSKDELDELKKAQLSELEKAQAQAQDMQRERDEALQRAQDTLIRSAFVAEAARLGAAHPEDAYALANLAEVVISEDGQATGAAEQVKAMVEAGRLPVSGKPRAPDLDAGAGGGERPGEGAEALAPEELRVAQRLGLKPEQYAEAKKKKEASVVDKDKRR